jgi:hypothetical protein
MSNTTVVFVLGLVTIAFIVVAFIPGVVSGQIESLYDAISSISPETVSRNLGGLITISAAAPNEIYIEYHPSDSKLYDVKIEKRVVGVRLVDAEYGMEGEVISKAAIDSVCYFTETKCEFKNTNYFTIEKSMNEDGYICNVNG